ncbi:hypothetical protein Noda2021_04350 [Candidatus Dependentiae bacterium Noda2021]|nr:hypothetical protein Noda2021_04350 [Candidatus Dependentiae bacterium Noda2021]
MKLLHTITRPILVAALAFSVPVLSMDKKSDSHYRFSENVSQGLDTVGKNLKTIGFNVAAGVGSGIVNATNALVPASEIFKQSLENPKTALALGLAGDT